MKKAILSQLVFCIICFLSSDLSFAKPVMKEKVTKAAKTFLVVRYPTSDPNSFRTLTKKGRSALGVKEVLPLRVDKKLVGYVVELEPAGFILFSSDDEIPPVKIYSNTDSFNCLPDGLIIVLELELLEDNDLLKSDKPKDKLKLKKYQSLWRFLSFEEEEDGYPTSISNTAILNTAWDQDDPYNLYCPSAPGGPDGRAWAGCTATALAQVLRHHNYPPAISMDHSYTDNEGSCQGTHLISDAGMGAYSWSNMPFSISVTSPSEQQQAVSQLIYHCAVALESDFEADGTAAFPSDVDDVLSTFFDYTSDNYVSKSNYSNTTWYNKIAEDIDDNQPVFYAMWESDGSHGHAVVCDGYRNGNEIHLDLGWSGSWTAWYNMDSVSASGYTWTKHGAVFNILPDVQEHPPTLTNYGFNPSPPVYPHTEIEFYVYYNDPEQFSPQTIEVRIDGVAHAMNQSLGDKYIYSTTISELGEHSYYFYAEDNEGLSAQTVAQFFNVISYEPGSFDILDYLINDSYELALYNNQDGIIQSGEAVGLKPKIKYDELASETATRIDVTLSSDNPCLEVWLGDRRYPDMNPGDTRYPEEGKYIRVIVDKSCSGNFYLDADIEWEGLDGVDQYEHLDNALSLDIQPEAWINISPDEYDFGAVKPRPEDDVVLTLKIQNMGTKILNISDIQTSHGDTEVSPTVFSINPGEYTDVTVTVHVSTLDGSITRDVYVIHDGRTKKDEDEHLVITGLVSNTPLSFEIPTVNRPFEPDISGSRIVWHEDRDGDANSDVLLYDANSGKQLLMPSSQYQQGDSFISGDIVVWKDSRNWDGNGQWYYQAGIYGYDLSTQEEFTISSEPMYQYPVGVSGNLIAIKKPYQTLETSTDVARNLIVYEYLGDGQRVQKYTTGFVPIGGTGDRPSIGDCDLNNGMLVFVIGDVSWGGTFSYGANDLYKIDFNAGETDQTSVNNHSAPGRIAAGLHNLVYSADDPVSNDEHIYLWPGNIKITPTTGDNYADSYLTFNGNIVVYDKDSSDNDMYYWDISPSSDEGLITNLLTKQDEGRMDGNGIVWEQKYEDSTYHINFTYLEQSDISVSSSNISFSNDNPLERTTIDVSVRIQNSTDYNVTGDITVKLFDGDPDVTGNQLGADCVIYGGMTAQSEASHTFTSIPVGIEGEHEIYVQVLVDVFDIYANNKASKTLSVEDGDTNSPKISNVWVTEYNGDGDGLVESDENILVQWQAIPQSPLSIANTYCQIADVNYVGEGSYHVILDPFAEGDYSFMIYADDNDLSPESATYEGEFSVAIDSIEGDTNNDGIVDFNDVVKVTSQWLNDNCSNGTRWCRGADLDHSTNVNFVDYSIIAANWQQELFLAFFNEPLDIDPGWSVEGEWQFGVPAGLGGGPFTGNPDPNSGYTGMNVYGVNLNGDYRTLAGGPYNLTTASIDCSDYHNVYLKFARWLNSDYAPYVTNKVEVSNDNVIWHPVWQSSSISPMEDSDWQLIEYDVSGYADNQPIVYVRWNYQTDGSAYPYSGWNIDDIELWGSPE